MYPLELESPAPGVWDRESTHVVRPYSRWFGAIQPAAFTRGQREAAERYGLLIAGEAAVINGFSYTRWIWTLTGDQVVPEGAASGPEARALAERCTRAFETRQWRDDLERWDTAWKPEMVEQNRRLASVDVDALSAIELADHLEACRVQLDHALYRHHALNLSFVYPIGELLLAVRAWTGRPTSEILGLLTGTSPFSVGAVDELHRLVRAVASDPVSLDVLRRPGAGGEAVSFMLGRGGEVAAALGAYLAVVGDRIVSGYDVSDVRAEESPELIVRTICSALDSAGGEKATRSGPAPGASAGEIRAEVPETDRATFDALLTEARLMNRLRDERAIVSDMWTTGIARRALLSAGRRLVSTGHLLDAEDAVDLTPREVDALLRTGCGPSAAEVAEYASYRKTKTIYDAPEQVGQPLSPMPSLESLPPAGARGVRIMHSYISEMMATVDTNDEKRGGAVILGIAAGGGVYEGIARVVLAPADFAKIERGDVLVARMTTPMYNVILPLIGALVTDRGGLLSHPAIVAREYGCPAVVGTKVATTAIADGSRVLVDGTTGRVRVLAPPSRVDNR
jgi:pyruvate,water dikinase